MTNVGLDREISQRLAEHEVRYTKGRRAVVAALAGAEGPLSALEVYARLGSGAPLSSIYRSLTVLETAGVLVPHFGQRNVTRFELAEWLQGHHHHLVCLDCGTVDDVDFAETDEATVDDVVARICSAAGFRVVSHTIEIEGRCARCH